MSMRASRIVMGNPSGPPPNVTLRGTATKTFATTAGATPSLTFLNTDFTVSPAVGDLIVFLLMAESDVGLNSNWTGQTLAAGTLASATPTTTDLSLQGFGSTLYRVRGSGDTSYTMSSGSNAGTNATAIGIALAFSHASLVRAINSGSQAAGLNSPSLTPGAATDTLIAWSAVDNNNLTPTYPTGLTNGLTIGSAASGPLLGLAVALLEPTGSGATGSRTWAWSGSPSGTASGSILIG